MKSQHVWMFSAGCIYCVVRETVKGITRDSPDVCVSVCVAVAVC